MWGWLLLTLVARSVGGSEDHTFILGGGDVTVAGKYPWQCDPEEFQRMLRMPPFAFELLLEKIGHKICKEDTPMRKAISAAERLSVTLKLLATGERSVSLSQNYRRGRCSVPRILHQVCAEIIEELGPIYMKGSLMTDGSHSCGISLLSSTWGLTAAHCLEYKDPSTLTVKFGTNQRAGGGVVVGAKRKIVHEKYGVGVGLLPNDIALIEFDEPVAGKHIQVIPLTTKGAEHSGNPDCWITGWGFIVQAVSWSLHTENVAASDAVSDVGHVRVSSGVLMLKHEGWVVPDVLQEAHINVLSQDACKDYWGWVIYDGLVCIADIPNKRGVCNGDSGGPLVCKEDGRYELVGVTSWAPSGCATDLPAGYTRVAYFRDWIREKCGI